MSGCDRMSMIALRWARASRGLTPTQKLVLMMLADAARENDHTCFNAAPSLAAETGLSDRAVRIALHDLIAAGAIAGEMRSGVRPFWTLAIEQTGTTFCLKRNGVPVQKRNHVPVNRNHVPAEKRNQVPVLNSANRNQIPTKPEPRSVEPEPGSDEPSITHIEPNREITLSLPDSRDGSAAFEAWWRAYPKKVGKDAADKAYASAVRGGVTDGALLWAVQRQSWPADRKYIPNPSTWLNQGRWKDDPDATAPSQVEPSGKQSRSEILAQHAERIEARRRAENLPFDLDGTAEELFP